MSPSLTHIALHVRDLDACIDFYRTYCGLHVVHERRSTAGGRVVWMAEEGREQRFILVFVPGGTGHRQAVGDYSHLGFALDSRSAVDELAARAQAAGCLTWPPRQEEYPVGYFCGISDPDGHVVEFSYGQPLGPGTSASRVE